MTVSLKINRYDRTLRVTIATILSFLISAINFGVIADGSSNSYSVIALLIFEGLVLYYSLTQYVARRITLVYVFLVALAIYWIDLDNSNQYIVALISGQAIFALYLHSEFEHERSIFNVYSQHLMSYYAIYAIFVTFLANIGKCVSINYFLFYLVLLTIISMVSLAYVPRFLGYCDRKLEPVANFIAKYIAAVIPDKFLNRGNDSENGINSADEAVDNLAVEDIVVETAESNSQLTTSSEFAALQFEQEKLQSTLEYIIETSSKYQCDIISQVNTNDENSRSSVIELQKEIKNIHLILETIRLDQQQEISLLSSEFCTTKFDNNRFFGEITASIFRLEQSFIPAISSNVHNLSQLIMQYKSDQSVLEITDSEFQSKFDCYAEFMQNSLAVINESIYDIQEIIYSRPKIVDLNKFKFTETERKILLVLNKKKEYELDEGELNTCEAIADVAECSTGSVSNTINRIRRNGYEWIEFDSYNINNNFTLINFNVKIQPGKDHNPFINKRKHNSTENS